RFRYVSQFLWFAMRYLYFYMTSITAPIQSTPNK
ncbi:hypothetical protein, partial [Aggregatibacter actinomycetemcomitans]